jgi:hypothetical protein
MAHNDTVRVQWGTGPTVPTRWVTLATPTGSATVTLPPVLSTTTQWVRSRTERDGFRSSAWTAAEQVVTGANQPALYTAYVTLTDDGTPVIRWTMNTVTNGVRIEWSIQPQLTDPVYTGTADVDASTGEYDLYGEIVSEGQQVNVRVTPWTGYSGGAVSGHEGVARTNSKARH